ncbi:glycine cleavage system transcriptional repressor [Microbacterium sp. HJ5]
MTTLVLTLVGDDRAGLVAAVADAVDAYGGNWENSELAELAGAFAGIVQISVDADRVDELRTALSALEGMLTVSVHAGSASGTDAATPRSLTIRVLGNDRPGIVREISSALRAHDLSIDRMTTETRDAAMYGGRLFEATVSARVPASVDLSAVTAELERLASEIQVDVVLGG